MAAGVAAGGSQQAHRGLADVGGDDVDDARDQQRDAHRVTRNGREVRLGPTEYRLLEFLMESPGRVFSRAQLLDGVWGHDVYVDERTVDVHIGRLRKAINRGRDRDPIRTVRGAGYAFGERGNAPD